MNFQTPDKNEGYDNLIHTDQFFDCFENSDLKDHFKLKFVQVFN